MYHVARMYSGDQWQFGEIDDVIKFFYTDEVHHNDAIVVEQQEKGIRAWIGTDFMQQFEADTIEDEELETWLSLISPVEYR